MSDDWRQQREKGNPFLLGLLTWIALKLGRRAIFVMLCPIVFYYFLFIGRARRASRAFLARALQRPPHWWEIYRHLLTFAVVSMDRILFLAGREKSFHLEIHGGELFSQYRGQGCVLLASHFGSFDAMRVMGVREQAIPVRILLDIQHNPNALNLIQRLDPELARGVIDARTPGPALALLLSECISRGEMVGIMADRSGTGESTTLQNFFGEPAPFPVGCWQLASVLQAPVIACFGVYHGGNHYALHFELIAERLGTSRRDRAAAIAQGMNTYCQRLEYHARQYPLNWFNFYDFWQHDTTGDH